MAAIVDQATIQSLLGRSLTPQEELYFDNLMNIAQGRLENLICSSLGAVETTIEFSSSDGHRTVFIGLWSDVSFHRSIKSMPNFL